ncbi:unnamed protein product [Penicillium nalgiovense]|nr:unnamed protein product [Penicillium nalgiovense]
MECLGIPIDHRLRRVIRETRHMDRDQENSEHLQLLRRFGSSLEIDNSDYPIFDLSFGLEMARPELKGGVLIVLQRPHSTRKNSDGFMQGKNECQSTAAVSELIRTVNNAKLGFDDVSVFDLIPFLNETAREKDHQDIVDEAQDVFADMVRAKDPDVILCCSTTETRNFLVKKLQSQGIGRSFYPDNPRLTEFGLSCILVNAFHPSYAVNFYPICCCFKRLLVLEFTKAFALCRQSWTEEPWMGDLRDECQIRAERKADETDISGKWNHSYLKEQWEELLKSLDEKFEECLFPMAIDFESRDIQHKLVNSKITWVSCDIAWILEQLSDEETIALGMPQQLLCKLRRWVRKAWPEGQLRHNSGSTNGYYDHVPLLLIKSNRYSARAQCLENKLFSLLRDLNLSFSRIQHIIHPNTLAQVCAFRRFAAAFEDILEEITENGVTPGRN